MRESCRHMSRLWWGKHFSNDSLFLIQQQNIGVPHQNLQLVFMVNVIHFISDAILLKKNLLTFHFNRVNLKVYILMYLELVIFNTICIVEVVKSKDSKITRINNHKI